MPLFEQLAARKDFGFEVPNDRRRTLTREERELYRMLVFGLAMVVMMLMVVVMTVPMIMMMAGLQTVPDQLLRAAQVVLPDSALKLRARLGEAARAQIESKPQR